MKFKLSNLKSSSITMATNINNKFLKKYGYGKLLKEFLKVTAGENLTLT